MSLARLACKMGEALAGRREERVNLLGLGGGKCGGDELGKLRRFATRKEEYVSKCPREFYPSGGQGPLLLQHSQRPGEVHWGFRAEVLQCKQL